MSKKQADNLNHRMRQAESMQRTTFKFKKDCKHQLIKYCSEQIEFYAAFNPGGGDPHPWGAEKNAVSFAIVRSMMEDQAKGAAHINHLFATE